MINKLRPYLIGWLFIFIILSPLALYESNNFLNSEWNKESLLTNGEICNSPIIQSCQIKKKSFQSVNFQFLHIQKESFYNNINRLKFVDNYSDDLTRTGTFKFFLSAQFYTAV
ncbi:MAG: hypothetical protein KKB34_15725 [Bacteroidetes bacterium]|nr:hypothetical protein [Bacteroidota bacterium]